MEKMSIKILKHYSMSAYPYNIKIKNCILIFILTSDLILKYSCAPCHKFFGCCIANTKLIGSNIKFFSIYWAVQYAWYLTRWYAIYTDWGVQAAKTRCWYCHAIWSHILILTLNSTIFCKDCFVQLFSRTSKCFLRLTRMQNNYT